MAMDDDAAYFQESSGCDVCGKKYYKTSKTCSWRRCYRVGCIRNIEATVALAFEAIPRTLAQNCGVNHANRENAWIRIDGNSGEVSEMKEKKIWDSYTVKAQTFNTAIEAACMLLRIDDIVSDIKKKQAPGSGPQKPQIEQADDADTQQMIPES